MKLYQCIAENTEVDGVEQRLTFDVTSENLINAATAAQEKIDGIDDEAVLISVVVYADEEQETK